MASSSGTSAANGQVLTDWAHTQQSIEIILTTPIGSRVMRRDFGSNIPDLVDNKMTPKRILEVYSAAAQAILKWEPRFRMAGGSVETAEATGRISIALRGVYYPRGHLGDYSVAEDAFTSVLVERALA